MSEASSPALKAARRFAAVQFCVLSAFASKPLLLLLLLLLLLPLPLPSGNREIDDGGAVVMVGGQDLHEDAIRTG